MQAPATIMIGIILRKQRAIVPAPSLAPGPRIFCIYGSASQGSIEMTEIGPDHSAIVMHWPAIRSCRATGGHLTYAPTAAPTCTVAQTVYELPRCSPLPYRY